MSTQPCVSALVRLRSSIACHWSNLIQISGRAVLQHKLAGLARTASDQELLGVQRGDPVFKTLFSRAESEVRRHCSRFGTRPQDIAPEFPSLTKLQSLTVAPPRRNPLPIAIVVVGGGLLLAVYLGAIFALGHLAYIFLGGAR